MSIESAKHDTGLVDYIKDSSNRSKFYNVYFGIIIGSMALVSVVHNEYVAAVVSCLIVGLLAVVLRAVLKPKLHSFLWISLRTLIVAFYVILAIGSVGMLISPTKKIDAVPVADMAKPDTAAVTEEPVPLKQVESQPEPVKQSEQPALSDCDMARSMLADAQPLLNSLHTEMNRFLNNPNLTYRDWSEWRVAGYNDAVSAVRSKYSSPIRIDYPYSMAVANDVLFGLDQTALEYYIYLRDGHKDADDKQWRKRWDSMKKALKDVEDNCNG